MQGFVFFKQLVLMVISVFCVSQWNSSLVPLWNQFLRIHDTNTHLHKIRFNIIFSYFSALSIVSRTLRYLSKHCTRFSFLPMTFHKSSHLHPRSDFLYFFNILLYGLFFYGQLLSIRNAVNLWTIWLHFRCISCWKRDGVLWWVQNWKG
jgi:hypothetical protein